MVIKVAQSSARREIDGAAGTATSKRPGSGLFDSLVRLLMHSVHLRDFRKCDASAVNEIGVAAFEQFASHYQDWPAFQKKIACMAALAESGEIIVAATDSTVVGAVAYLGPQAPKSDFFPNSWAVMRMLVVSPEWRGQGLGHTLAKACLSKALRDGAEIFGLHTSPIMSVALPMYLRMGFKFVREAPSIHGVAYDIYAKHLTEQCSGAQIDA